MFSLNYRMNLSYKSVGEGKPLVILHGLYGSSDNWYSIAKELSVSYKVYLLDLRNHGHSPHSDSMTFADMCGDVMDFFQLHNIEKAALIGHSMGGKVAMQFALFHPEKIEKLIIVDIAPRSYMSLMEPSRQVLDHMNIISSLTDIDLDKYRTREEVDNELAQRIPDSKTRLFLLKNLQRSAESRMQWRLNINAIRNQLPNIMKGIDVPENASNAFNNQLPFSTLFIKGERSDYVTETDLAEIKKMFPKSDVVTIFDASHWVHAEQPELFLKTVKYFLES